MNARGRFSANNRTRPPLTARRAATTLSTALKVELVSTLGAFERGRERHRALCEHAFMVAIITRPWSARQGSISVLYQLASIITTYRASLFTPHGRQEMFLIRYFTVSLH